nr:hypothetical protein HmN_000760000 [Hymenolepis microstoma]
MGSLASGSELKEEMLKRLWMKCLPGSIVPFLITSPSRDDLDKLAEEADFIYDHDDIPGVNAMKTSVPTDAPSTDSDFSKINPIGPEMIIISHSAEKCFLQPTDRSNIFKPLSLVNIIECQELDMVESIETNCQQSSTMVNSVEKSDTDLVQIDTRELPIELPSLADDSGSIHEDILNQEA